MTNIPSEEDFARAKRWIAEVNRGLDKVEQNVMKRFAERIPLRRVFVLGEDMSEFRIYVFLEKDADVEACRRSGMVPQIEAAVHEELERVGRGGEHVTVNFEFDSHERVMREFHGDYLLRLHA